MLRGLCRQLRWKDPMRGGAGPNCDAVGKEAFNGAAVEVHHDQRRRIDGRSLLRRRRR